MASDTIYKLLEDAKAENKRLQAEVDDAKEKWWYYAKEMFRCARKLDETERQLSTMTALCKAAEGIISHVPYKDSNIRNVFLVGMDEAVDKWLTLKKEAGK